MLQSLRQGVDCKQTSAIFDPMVHWLVRQVLLADDTQGRPPKRVKILSGNIQTAKVLVALYSPKSTKFIRRNVWTSDCKSLMPTRKNKANRNCLVAISDSDRVRLGTCLQICCLDYLLNKNDPKQQSIGIKGFEFLGLHAKKYPFQTFCRSQNI